jgi:hypothetical protein
VLARQRSPRVCCSLLGWLYASSSQPLSDCQTHNMSWLGSWSAVLPVVGTVCRWNSSSESS